MKTARLIITGFGEQRVKHEEGARHLASLLLSSGLRVRLIFEPVDQKDLALDDVPMYLTHVEVVNYDPRKRKL